MKGSLLRATIAGFGMAACLVLAAPSIEGQSPAAPQREGAAPAGPRTPDGRPDFQGTYNVATLTPVERPDGHAARHHRRAGQAARTGRSASRAARRGAEPGGPRRAGGRRQRRRLQQLLDRSRRLGHHHRQAAPQFAHRRPARRQDSAADGRGQKPEHRARGQAVRPTADAPESAGPQGDNAYDDPEIRPLGERCLLGFGSTSGPPTLPNYFYNNLKQIVQTKDSILILVEMVHDARIIRLNQPHLPSDHPQVDGRFGRALGGRHAGRRHDELHRQDAVPRLLGEPARGRALHARRRRQPALSIHGRGSRRRGRSRGRASIRGSAPPSTIYEYACHEGNYALADIMRGARFQEKAAQGEGKR